LNDNLAVETTSMSHADWRNPSAYEELQSLDAPGFAWNIFVVIRTSSRNAGGSNKRIVGAH
jgi:hypothetical protein